MTLGNEEMEAEGKSPRGDSHHSPTGKEKTERVKNVNLR
jgi:hypothetical protein